MQHPRQGDLRGGGPLLLREAGQQVQQWLVGPDVVFVEAGDGPPDVVAGVGVAADALVEQPHLQMSKCDSGRATK